MGKKGLDILMLELISSYSITEIIVFLIIFALALKGIISFWDWITERLEKVFRKQTKTQKEKENIEERLDRGSEKFDALFDGQRKQSEQINQIMNKIDLLIESDKSDIKSFITREHHHFCYEQKWIDDYSLDCIEKRYKFYADEGGNSFVARLMQELRELPKKPLE